MADDADAAPPDLIFDDREEQLAAAAAASAFTTNILSCGGDPPNDVEVRCTAYDGAEALHYVLRQTREPDPIDAALMTALEVFADLQATARRLELDSLPQVA